ncbi:methyltransferase family protein [Niabella soli]|uniref:Isoprenylcysteine carboxyl methyltransferase n=1 Tax=Niabella soli DSM 19437 TaxID=929713 RepID=W0F4J1_9BACT|nr:isoprenylcysteine carboxylmethyltransferase family protein [Niabella soli]AHF16713.1 isoprenylcysteine carboxyl methyltransferase [Niabella soli DSM 19437]
MKVKQDSPGVYIPPPLLYVLIFIAAVFLQKKFNIDDAMLHTKPAGLAGVLLFIAALFFLASSLTTFFKTKNTVVLIKAATSLQTTGIYGISRNPMYVGLLFVYLGLVCFIGNWWHLILVPLLIFIIQAYVIKREEKYLERAFGNQFLAYKKRVRRWL